MSNHLTLCVDLLILQKRSQTFLTSGLISLLRPLDSLVHLGSRCVHFLTWSQYQQQADT